MTYNDIEVGKNYVFDPNNLMNQTETGISVIHITDKKKRFLMPSIIYGKSLWEFTAVSPCPGKCFNTLIIPASLWAFTVYSAMSDTISILVKQSNF